MSGCFLMRRDWYEAVRPSLSGLGFKILVDVVASGRRRPIVEQIPTVLRARAGGESKLDLRVAVDLDHPADREAHRRRRPGADEPVPAGRRDRPGGARVGAGPGGPERPAVLGGADLAPSWRR
jgi:hypothetical protein